MVHIQSRRRSQVRIATHALMFGVCCVCLSGWGAEKDGQDPSINATGDKRTAAQGDPGTVVTKWSPNVIYVESGGARDVAVTYTGNWADLSFASANTAKFTVAKGADGVVTVSGKAGQTTDATGVQLSAEVGGTPLTRKARVIVARLDIKKPDGTVLTDPAAPIACYVGPLMALRGIITPAGAQSAGGNWQWTFESASPNALKSYGMDAQDGQPTPLAGTDLQSEEMDFHWTKSEHTAAGVVRDVSCSMTLGGTTFEAATQFRVKYDYPGWVTVTAGIWGKAMSEVKMATYKAVDAEEEGEFRFSCRVYFGKGVDDPGDPGMLYKTIPLSDHVNYLQLAKSSPVIEYYDCNPADDGATPVWSYQPPEPEDGEASTTALDSVVEFDQCRDSPGVPLEEYFPDSTDKVLGIKVEQHFRTYVMCRPNKTTGIWVPTKYFDWSWHATGHWSAWKNVLAEGIPVRVPDNPSFSAGSSPALGLKTAGYGESVVTFPEWNWNLTDVPLLWNSGGG